MKINRVLLLLVCLLFTFLFYLSFSFQSYAHPHPGTGGTPTHHPITPSTTCGLPQGNRIQWNTGTTQTVYNLTADCVFPDWPPRHWYIRVYSGEFTINGNGYSIIGPVDNWIFAVTGGTLRMNNLSIVGAPGAVGSGPAGQSWGVPLRVNGAGALHLTNVVIRNHTVAHPCGIDQGIPAGLYVDNGGSAYLTNVQFLNNDATVLTCTPPQATRSEVGSALTLWGAAEAVLDNVTFRNNRGLNDVVTVVGSTTLRLRGCVRFENNVRADGGGARNIYVEVRAALDNQSRCPEKKEEPTKMPWPTNTPRPPESYSEEYTELQEDTGIAITTTHGLASGIHFRQLDGAGIGVQSLIDAGPLAAIDVYGYADQMVEVCFPHIGRVVFLDAATSPRTIVPLESWVVNGSTCVMIGSAGSLVVLPPE